MSVVLEFPTGHRHTSTAPRGAILEQLEAMDDAVEIGLDQLAAGRRPTDVLADIWRAAAAWATQALNDTPEHDQQAVSALDALDHLPHLDGAA